MITRIHVNQHTIRSNKKQSKDEPPITVKTYKRNAVVRSVDIVDDSGKVICNIIYSPDKPLSCGATVWVQADSKNVRVNE